MSLSVVSNPAANQANTQLNRLSSSIEQKSEQLASGLRVVTAQDDVAASAISSRLEAEVSGLEQAARNAEQADSLLQIADGAFNNTEQRLARAQQLAVQAGSDNVAEAERSFLDQEFQAIKDELDRLANDTEFSGRQLVNGAVDATSAGASLTNGGAGSFSLNTDNFGAMGVTFAGSQDDSPSLSLTSGVSFSVSASGVSTTGTGGTFSATLMASFSSVMTLDAGTTNFTGTVSSVGVSVAGTTAANMASSIQLTNGTTLLASATGTNGQGSFSVMLGNSTNVLSTTTSISAGPGSTTFMQTISTGTVSYTGNEFEMLNFAVGTGTEANADQIEVSVGSIDTRALGLQGTDLLTRSNAEQANGAIDTALDTLASRRSEVAAAQNRLDAAMENVDTSIQNQDAANSSLIELNVADASTDFSQEQVRFQAASSTLTQAQQLPQNLLGLFQ